MSTATVSSAIKDANRNTPFSKRFKSQWWRHLLGIIAVVFAAFPLVYVLSASLAPGGTLTGSNKLFSQTDFSNYSKLVSDPVRPYAQWYLNTLIIAMLVEEHILHTSFTNIQSTCYSSPIDCLALRINLLD